MHNFMLTLLFCSAIMSLISLMYMAANPLLAKRYSEKGRYYVWLIILLWLIIPFRPQWNNALIHVPLETTRLPPVTITTTPLPPQAAPLAYSIPSIEPFQIAFIVWLIGAIIFLTFHLIKHLSFVKRAVRWGKIIENNSILESLKSEMGISKHIALIQCEGIGSPTMLGFIKPQILLPTADLPQNQLRFILKHELIHYKRGDIYYKCLVLVATAIHWFNPIIYMAAKAINAQCELSCDAEVIKNADDSIRQQYSEAIIGVVRYQSDFKTALSTTFYGGKKSMKNRIYTIMDNRKKRIGAVVMFLVLAATLSTGLVLAAGNSPQQPYFNSLYDFAEPFRELGLSLYIPEDTRFAIHLGRISQDRPLNISTEADVDLLLEFARMTIEQEQHGFGWDICVDDALNAAGLNEYFMNGWRQLTRPLREQAITDLATRYTRAELEEMYFLPARLECFQALGFFLD